VSDAVTTPAEPGLPEGERRQVTVLFADMVGFTQISERLGEEGTFALIQPIYELMAGAVKEEGGSVKDFTGDGIMALFGVPEALEDGPLRACRAGLTIQERLAAAAPAIEAKHRMRPQVRVGVNSGPAVVTQIRSESGPATALGDTVNVASRLQALAEPGTVYLSEATQRLVQGLVETTFAGAHAIKGKTEPQKVYRLEAIRRGATRFEAPVGRGLSAYVGRERELDVLRRALDEARKELHVIDLVSEPGMGKSRLLHEFRQGIAESQLFILRGTCSPDGQQTPFLPFIEVVRGSFRVKAGEAESEIARKLDVGLKVLGLQSAESLALLLNLLGKKPPEGALAGLDGVLIGLRTRDLLQRLLEARCRLSHTVLLIEDLHWIDSVSQEVLAKIVGSEAEQHLLICHTRRPEYEPAWCGNPHVSTVRLEPLPTGDIRHLIEARLGVEALPEALVRKVTEKADGNALFAEEILSFLEERGALRVIGGKVEIDAAAVNTALPASVRSLLTARVDRLAPKDRRLLQAAAVMGRSFDPLLLSAVADSANDTEARLAQMRALDLIHAEGKSSDYSFKHALVRDALYQSLLTGPRVALHLKIAEEIERRNGNRLTEVVEALAHHYGQTDRADKAFAFLAMAAAKSLGLYAFDEAERHFTAAIALLDKSPDCANDAQLTDLLADFTIFSNLAVRLRSILETVERFAARLDRIGDHPALVQIFHQYVLALLWSGRYADARSAQKALSDMAARLSDPRSVAYALASEIHLATNIAPLTTEEFEKLTREAMAAASQIEDAYLQYFLRFVISWEEFHRGRMLRASAIADEGVEIGNRNNDPRSMGFGLNLKSWIAISSDDYQGGLDLAEAALRISSTEFDKLGAQNAKIAAHVLLRRPDSYAMCSEFLDRCAANGWHWRATSIDGLIGVAMVIRGEIGRGIKRIEEASARREKEGYRALADWYKGFLVEVYIEIISGRDKPPLNVMLRNAVSLAKVFLIGEKRIAEIVTRLKQSPQVDPNGHHFGRCEMDLGLYYKAKGKHALALQHLTEAKRIASQFGPTPMLAKIETALAEIAGNC
jgi:class 3 adenylate cyclase